MKMELTRRLNRRVAIATGLSVASATALATQSDRENSRSGLGLVIYCRGIRRRWLRKEKEQDLFQPLAFLRHCLASRAGGAQIPLGVLSADEAAKLRDFASASQLFLEASIRPPRNAGDVERFDAEVRTAAAAGALAARTVVMPGRRYEQFKTRAAFQEAERHAEKMLRLAKPVVEKHRVPLAVENHKDQRLEERVKLLKAVGSDYVGACVDTGNSVALLDDPYEVIDALAPYAFAVHLKDQAVRATPEGFLLADIPLGQGSLDLPRMVTALRKVKPKIRFALELITRDPLRVPCLTANFWRTMPKAPAAELAAAIRFVRDNQVDRLQQVSDLPLAEQVKLEDNNVRISLDYARETLKI